MEEWEKEHPYWIDQKWFQEKPKSKRPRPQTVKERKAENYQKFRVMNGLSANTEEIDKVKNGRGCTLSLKCKFVLNQQL